MRCTITGMGHSTATAASAPPRLRVAPAGASRAAVLGAAGVLVCALVPGVAVGSARALPDPADTPAVSTDQSGWSPTAPHPGGPDAPALEALVRSLRATAQGDKPAAAAPRSPGLRPPAGSRAPPAATEAASPAQAAWLLGLLALHGMGMAPDAPQAQQWFERAQALGHPLAPAGLAWCQISGCVTAPNPAGASRWTSALVRNAPALAKYLQWHAAVALSPLEAPDRTALATTPPGTHLQPPPARPQLRALLAEAASAGSAQAANDLGLEYLAAGQLNEALQQFRSAAPQSGAAAANARLLASRLRADEAARNPPGRQTPGDWYDQARRYHRGEGVPANYTEAVRLYQIAASAGDRRARRMLELIFSRPAPTGTVDPAWMQQLAAMAAEADGASGRPAPRSPPAPPGWQTDPSPLYHLIPLQWRGEDARPAAVR
jgi:TPR repeat protein